MPIGCDVVGLDVERLGVEVERERLAGRQPNASRFDALPFEQVREERDAPSTLLVAAS